MLISLIKQISPFCKENPKPTSSKVYDSLREKAPKAIADNTYCAVFWYVLQDLCARVGNQNAAWLSRLSTLSNHGSPTPAGRPHTAVWVMPPTLS